MVTQALLVRLDARHGREDALEQFLKSALDLVRAEPATTAWFALRFGRGEYGIFDAFPDEAGREAHLAGRVAEALKGQGASLLAQGPRIQRVAVLASKLPADPTFALGITRALLLTFRARPAHEAQVESFLHGARTAVAAETGTLAWFALSLEGGEYGIFDAFADNGARLAHLTGEVPRQLARHGVSLLGGVPDMEMPQVLAAHFAEPAVASAA
jgi:quinol monooxygenase YgiN